MSLQPEIPGSDRPGPDLHMVADLDTPRAGTFSRSLAQLVSRMHDAPAKSVLLEQVVAGAVGTIPGCDHAALVIYDKHDQLVAQAVSGAATTPMIALQNRLAEGPCRDTAARNLVMRAPDVLTDLRWPRFAQQAAELGISSMLCVPLTVGERVYGSLSMASGSRGAFDAESEVLATVFATHAAIAMADGAQLAALRDAVETRDLIGQAKGILMERYRVDDVTAFAVLVRESQDQNMKIRLVSQTLRDTGELPSRRPARSWPVPFVG